MRSDCVDVELEIGSHTVTLDINGIDGNDVDFTVTDVTFDPDVPIFTAFDEEDPSEDDIRDEVMTYAEEIGLI
jgi:hypothetical protein